MISGSGQLDTGEEPGPVSLEPGTAVWLRPGLRYTSQARPGPDLEVLAVTLRAGSADAGRPGAAGGAAGRLRAGAYR